MQKKNFAVILSGCGVFDGSEIHEAVLTFLEISKAGCKLKAFAPNTIQQEVVDHLNETGNSEERNVLNESARIARSEVFDIKDLKVEDFDAIVFPGGFGVAKNLSNLAVAGKDVKIREDVEKVILDFYRAKKPIAAMCIAPALIAACLAKQGVKITATIGNKEDCENFLEIFGANAIPKTAAEIVVDEENKVITTPAYMQAKDIGEASVGIEKLVSYLKNNS